MLPENMYRLILVVTSLLTIVNCNQPLYNQPQDAYGKSIKLQTNNTNNQTVWDIELSSDIIELQWHGKPEMLEINVVGWPAGVKLVAIEGSIDKTDVAVIEGARSRGFSCLREDNSSYTFGQSDALYNSSGMAFSYSEESYNCSRKSAYFTLKPLLIGRATLSLNVTYYNIVDGKLRHEPLDTHSIVVLKKKRVIDTVFQIVIYIMVTISTLGMGTKIDMKEIKKNLKKPKAPVIALISQFTFMPLLSYGIIHLQGYTGGTALGFFALGCAPGGGASNMYSHLLGGNLSISVTMTLLSTIASLGMIPLWLYTLGATLPADDGQSISIPFLSILQTFALTFVPLGIGLIIQYKLPRVAKVIKKLLKVYLLFMVIFMFTFGVYTNLYIFQMFNPSIVFTSACLPYGGFILGGLFAVILRFEWSLIKTIAIETGLQNVGIPFIIIMSVFVSPDLELAIIPVAASSIMSPLPLLLATICYTIYNKCKSKHSSGKESNSDESENRTEEQEMEDIEEKVPLNNKRDDSTDTLEEIPPLYTAAGSSGSTDDKKVLFNIT